MIRCEHVLQELSNFLDHEVAEALRREIEEHLRGCRNCTVLVDTTRMTLRLVAENQVFELPPGVAERLLARLHLQLR